MHFGDKSAEIFRLVLLLSFLYILIDLREDRPWNTKPVKRVFGRDKPIRKSQGAKKIDILSKSPLKLSKLSS